jgi:hypothetical protein
MTRNFLTAVAVVLCAAASLPAGDTKTKRPVGTWTRSVGDFSVTFSFETDTLKCILAGAGVTLDIDADYSMSKDGVIFGRISKVDKKGACVGPNVGDLFTFRFAVKGDTLTLSDLGPADQKDARELIEGEYKAAKKK